MKAWKIIEPNKIELVATEGLKPEGDKVKVVLDLDCVRVLLDEALVVE